MDRHGVLRPRRIHYLVDVVRAEGAVAHGVHDLQEAGWIGGMHDLAFDISSVIPKDSWYGTLLKGVFNFQPDPTILQLTAWALYLVPTLVFFLSGSGGAAPKPAVPVPVEAEPAS